MPDDPLLLEMDPVLRIWMQNHWIADQNDNAELAKNLAYLLASFDHPDAVKQMMGVGNVHESSDEEYEETLAMVKNQNIALLMPKEENQTVRRRRRPLKKE